jgi:short-subunit dehydrogenase
MSYSAKSIIITGASSGLGKALALNLASQGAALTLAARRFELLEALQKNILERYKNTQILIVKSDVTSAKDSKELVQESIKFHKKLDIFIANAGQSMWSRFRDIAHPQELLNLMQLNYMGVVNGAFYALPYLQESKGSFVAISSIQGAIPVAFHSGYVASKYAVSGFIDTLRLEEPDIHFMLAMPSWISGTELRAHALTGSAQNSVVVNKKHGKHAISAESCALEILKALELRKNQIFIPKKYKYIPALRLFFGSLLDKIIQSRVKKQLRAE